MPRSVVVFALAVAMVPALATGTEPRGYEGESFAGDGKTPTFLDVLSARQPKTPTMPGAQDVGGRGEATYAIPFDLPASIFGPQLGLAYSSDASHFTMLSKGWSVSGLATLVRVTPRQASGAYALDQDVLFLNGAGFSGYLKRVGDRYRLMSSDPRLVEAWPVDATGNVVLQQDLGLVRGWVVHADGAHYRFGTRPDGPGFSWSSSPRGITKWRIERAEDAHGNYYEVEYDTRADAPLDQVKKVSFGAFTGRGSSPAEPHHAWIDFTYGAPTGRPTPIAYSSGVAERYRDRLEAVQIAVATVSNGGSVENYRDYRLLYREDPLWGGEVGGFVAGQVLAGLSTASAAEGWDVLASFEYGTMRTEAGAIISRWDLESNENLPLGQRTLDLIPRATTRTLSFVRGPDPYFPGTEQRAYTQQLQLFTDFTHDGLVDIVAADANTPSAVLVRPFVYRDEDRSQFVFTRGSGNNLTPKVGWKHEDLSWEAFYDDEWDDVANVPNDGEVGDDSSHLTETVTLGMIYGNEPWGGHSYTTKRLVDVDGDGWQDIVYSDMLPEFVREIASVCEVETCSAFWPVKDENLIVAGEGTPPVEWLVSYGGPDGNFAPFVAEPTVFYFPGYARAESGLSMFIDYCDDTAAEQGEIDLDHQYRREGETFTMLDVDSDGWQDLVYFPNDLREDVVWYRRHPSRQLGWDDTPRLLIDGVDDLPGVQPPDPELCGDTLRCFATSVSRQYVKMDPTHDGRFRGIDPLDCDGDAVWDTLGDEPGGANKWYLPFFTESRQVSSFLDMNGDGLLDFVYTEGATEWRVWLGHGGGFAPGPRFWNLGSSATTDPLRALSYTDEGAPSIQECEQLTPNMFYLGEAVMQGADGADQWRPLLEFDTRLDNETCVTVLDYEPAVAHSRMMDVDGDGLVDLAAILGSNTLGSWWRNTGDGFSDPLPLPAYFPVGGFERQFSYQLRDGAEWRDSETWGYVAVDDFNGDRALDVLEIDPEPGSIEATPHITFGKAHAAGLLTRVYSGSAALDVSNELVADKLEASTTIEYAPRALAWPSASDAPLRLWDEQDPDFTGAWDAPTGELCEYAGRGLAAQSVTVRDFVTGEKVRTEWSYRSPQAVDGALVGFAEVEKSVSERTDSGSLVPLLRETTTFDASSRDFVLPRSVAMFTDANLSHIPNAGAGSSTDWVLRSLSVHAYEDTPGGRWLVARCATQFAEDVSEAEANDSVIGDIRMGCLDPSWAPAASLVGRVEGVRETFAWTSEGGLTDAVAENILDPSDARTTSMTWAAQHATSPADVARSRSLMLSRTVREGTADAIVEQIRYGYDGAVPGSVAYPIDVGDLTSQEVCADGVDGGAVCGSAEALRWDFLRHGRGNLAAVFGPAAETVLYPSYDLGGAVRTREEKVATAHKLDGTTESVLHATNWLVDPRGHVMAEQSPDGVVRGRDVDHRNRPLFVGIWGVGQPSWKVTETWAYHDDVVPRWSEHAWLRADGSVDRTEYEVFDGQGKVVQRWKPLDPTLSALECVSFGAACHVVQDFFYNLRGQLVVTSYPRVAGAFVPPSGAIAQPSADQTGRRSYFDAFGLERVSYADRAWAADMTAGDPLGHVGWRDLIDPIEPLAVLTRDAEGYEKIVRHDVWGRVREVEESRNGVAASSSFTYDANGRVLSFTDANGNVYAYDWDGAGRIRRVKRGTSPSQLEDWYAYEFEGPFPTEMYEGSVSSGTKVVTWAHDELGRTYERQVLDRATSPASWQTYRWEYDTAWVGARAAVQDPLGSISWGYGVTHPSVGSLGLPTAVTRDFGPDTYTVSYAYDDLGRVIEVDYPEIGDPNLTAVTVETLYASGWRAQDTVSTPGDEVALSYSYDRFGETSWLAGGYDNVPAYTMGARRFRTHANHVDRVCFGGTHALQNDVKCDVDLGYTYYRNGMVHTLGVDVWDELGAFGVPQRFVETTEPFVYEYDHLKRAAAFKHAGGGIPADAFASQTLETYQYDDIGNMRSITRNPTTSNGLDVSGVTWTYDAPDGFGRVPRRRVLAGSYAGATESYSYGPMGRLVEIDAFGPSIPGVTGDAEFTPGARHFKYDGLGHLTRATSLVRDERLVYDGDDKLVSRIGLQSGQSTTWFNGVRYDTAAGEVEIEALDALHVVNGEFRWMYKAPSGQLVATYDHEAVQTRLGFDGVYGRPVYSSGPPLASYALHGAELDMGMRTLAMGTRVALYGDGMWLQPEPLLYLSPASLPFENPRSLTGVYASGNPVMIQDPSGYWWETAWDVYNVVQGVKSCASNIASGNYKAAAVDAAGVLLDAASVVSPTPGGAGTAIKVARMAENAGDAVGAARTTAKGVDAAATASKVADGASTASQASKAADGAGDGARFIGQPDGQLVDTHSTPRGSYDQPGGGRTDILQKEDHGAGLSHTHDPNVNTNPKTGQTFVNGRQQPGRPVSADDVKNIESGAATPSDPKGR
jgi:YD repeat-containing protein